MRILVAGYQHETNTFAPTLADWSAFTRGESFPAFVHGEALLARMRGVNLPIGGFIAAAHARGWQVLPSAWAGATPSSFVTRDAFERIAEAVLGDVRRGGFDAVYLDLHGAAVAEHAPDSEGELLARVRAAVGPALPIVASLDLHANVTPRMLHEADALVAYRSYPHVDMADTGALAAELLARRVAAGRRQAMGAHRLPFLIPLNAQSTWMQPAQGLYEALRAIDRRHGTVSSLCMGFPASDFDGCAPMAWSHGDHAQAAADELFALAGEPTQWRPQWLQADAAVGQGLQLAGQAGRPVVIADTQDHPGAGGDSNTTGMMHALLRAGAGRRHPGRIALGMLFDPAAAARAHAAGSGAQIDLALGTAVPTFTGQPSDPPVQGRCTVRALSDGRVTLPGAMMTGLTLELGPSACLEIDGVLVAVVSGKAQLLDRAMLAMVGIEAEAMKIIVVKSSNHFRADFTPIASQVLVAKAAGPMAADPGDLPWQHLSPDVRTRP